MKIYKSLVVIGVATLAMLFADSDLVGQQQPGQQQPGQRQGGQRQGGQRQGGQRPGGFGGGQAVNATALVDIKEVRTEIEMLESQYEELKAALTKIRDDARAQQGERPNFRELDEDARAKLIQEFRDRAEKQRKSVDAKVKEILLPHQSERLDEIALQVEGIRALLRDAIAKELKITAEQKEKMQKVQTDSREKMQAQIREIFQSGDREKIREVFTQMQQQSEKDILAVLTESQKTQFTAMKGKEFKLPEGALRGGGRGQGGQRGGGQGGQRPGGGQQRPGGDNNNGQRPPARPST
ncbi:MAG: hypothetical protein VB855_16630 [Pirellulaceae bacterium]